jgi:transposase InsO family protein
VNSHKSARLTVEGRKLLIERIAVMGLMPAAAAAGISARCARKWRRRFEQEGHAGLVDRSCRPHRTRSSIEGGLAQRIEALRRARMPMRRIASTVGRSAATVSRFQLGRIEREGHRIHGDRTTRVRGAGWEFAHVAIDDHSRIGFVQMHADEGQSSAVAFLRAAVAHYAALGITIERLLTDNGNAYRSRLFARTCGALGIKHSFTRPYRPQTNGKAERFIQTCLREWAYGRAWSHSDERTSWLPSFLAYYNARRPHSALGYKPPASRLGQTDLLQLNS